MVATGQTKTENIIEIDESIVEFFDMLARFQFEDEKHLRLLNEKVELEIASSLTGGEAISGSNN